ncbi:MAG: hypothetical protein ACJ760_12795 [Thermoleophilaceae bacterium]
MDSTQTQFGPILPAVDAFGAPHLAYEDTPGSPPAWTGDPAAVPLPAVGDPPFGGQAGRARSGDELDEAIFAALLAP